MMILGLDATVVEKVNRRSQQTVSQQVEGGQNNAMKYPPRRSRLTRRR